MLRENFLGLPDHDDIFMFFFSPVPCDYADSVRESEVEQVGEECNDNFMMLLFDQRSIIK